MLRVVFKPAPGTTRPQVKNAMPPRLSLIRFNFSEEQAHKLVVKKALELPKPPKLMQLLHQSQPLILTKRFRFSRINYSSDNRYGFPLNKTELWDWWFLARLRSQFDIHRAHL